MGDAGGESVQLLCDLNSLAVRMKTLQGDINVWSPNKTPKLVTANNNVRLAYVSSPQLVGGDGSHELVRGPSR